MQDFSDQSKLYSILSFTGGLSSESCQSASGSDTVPAHLLLYCQNKSTFRASKEALMKFTEAADEV